MKPSLLSRFTLVLLYLCLLVGFAFLGLLPKFLPLILLTSDLQPDPSIEYALSLACWMLGSLGGLFILFTLIRMMKSLREDPFVLRNVHHLRNMGCTALCMTALTIIAAALSFRPLLPVIAMAELLCALFSLVLCSVFKKAVEYREENALTI